MAIFFLAFCTKGGKRAKEFLEHTIEDDVKAICD